MLLLWLTTGLLAGPGEVVAVEQRGRGASARRLREEARRREEEQAQAEREQNERREAVVEAVRARLPRKARVKPAAAPPLVAAPSLADDFAIAANMPIVMPELPDAPNVDLAEVFGLSVEQTYDLEFLLLAA